MNFNVLYENNNLLVIDKTAGISVFSESPTKEKTLSVFLLEKFPFLKKVANPPRYGIVHRLDRETSGVLLIAKNKKSLNFYQKQFKERKVIKRYIALVLGKLKQRKGKIETLIGRSPDNRLRQKVFLPFEPAAKGKRRAITKYRVLKIFSDGNQKYTLVEVEPETGRKHQIRVHFKYIGHPVLGDRLYGFKNQIFPGKLKRLFLHAFYLKISLLNNKKKEFKSKLPGELEIFLNSLNEIFE